ncbi:MAG: hypothetical protein EPO21_10415 [Chloroflexota bacterium]|nr:MAG: hypothetical protein EPO21_10415 [Chloroflexota bacterium]
MDTAPLRSKLRLPVLVLRWPSWTVDHTVNGRRHAPDVRYPNAEQWAAPWSVTGRLVTALEMVGGAEAVDKALLASIAALKLPDAQGHKMLDRPPLLLGKCACQRHQSPW